jgi:hypothetical protein
MMSAELDWTQKLGDAVLAQQPDVMAAIQRLRLRAQDNGKLTTTPAQRVTTEQQDNRRNIVIEQANDDTVFVPAYDPGVVFGAWPYPDYPPYFWDYPDYWGFGVAPGVLARGLWFGTGFGVGRWGAAGWGWGGRVNWGNGNIIRNWPRATPYNLANLNNIGNRAGNIWQHNPAHRGGVRYSNANVQQRFGNANRGGGLGGNRGAIGAGAAGIGAGAAIRAGQRSNVANRQAQRHGANNRQGQRHNAGNRAANRTAGNRTGNRHAGNRPAHRTAANRGNHAGNRAGNRAANRPAAGNLARGGHNVGARGGLGGARAGVGHMGGGGGRGGGFRGGGGGFRGGGGGGGGRGGGRRSDIALKHDIVLLGHLDDGLGFYRFAYNGSDKAYVGIIAQEVQRVMPTAVMRGRDGYLRVFYDKLAVRFDTYDHWLAAGAHVPSGPRLH